MRIYGTTRIPAYIREKSDVVTRFSGKTRPKTAEDFEIVPEHDEETLLEVRCDICGVPATYIADGDHSSHIAIQLERGLAESSCDDVTADFLGDWYEVCESCLRSKILPVLHSLRGSSPPPPEPEEAPAVLSVSDITLRGNGIVRGPLIGEEDDTEQPLSLPPLSDDEPF